MSFANRFQLPALFLIVVLVVSACSTKHDIYDWGSYNQIVKDMYNTNSEFKIDIAIEQLGTEIEQTVPAKVPPGKAALLGYLYASRGDSQPAKKYFQLEKQLFPEAGAFTDQLLIKN